MKPVRVPGVGEEPRYTLEEVRAGLLSDEVVKAVAELYRPAGTLAPPPLFMLNIESQVRRDLNRALNHFTQQPAEPMGPAHCERCGHGTEDLRLVGGSFALCRNCRNQQPAGVGAESFPSRKGSCCSVASRRDPADTPRPSADSGGNQQQDMEDFSKPEQPDHNSPITAQKDGEQQSQGESK